VAKDKKDKKAKDGKNAKPNDRLELLGHEGGDKKKSKKAGKNKDEGQANGGGGLEALATKVLDHPLVADLLAVGALAAVAAIAESGKLEPAEAKSKDAVKKAGKAAAAAIGTRLLKEVTGSGAAKKA